jgi:hypothetical protein
MGGNRRVRRAATRALLWAGGVALFIGGACEKTNELDWGWVKVADVPAAYRVPEALAADGAAVYICAARTSDDRLVILKYLGGNFEEAYVSPYKFWEDAQFNDVAFYDGEGWAAGLKTTGEHGLTYYLLNRENGVWRELKPHGLPNGIVTGAYPFKRRACWLTGGGGHTRGGELFKYDDGAVTPYPALGTLTGFGVSASGPRAAAVRNRSGLPAGVYVSDDYGATWAAEEATFDAFGYEYQYTRGCAVRGDEAFIIANLVGEAWGIVRRAAPGAYELSFLDVVDPVLDSIGQLAFDERGRGVAVGGDASVVYDGARWFKESIPGHAEFRDVTPAAGGGFWALISLGPSDAALYYHP